MSAGGKELGVTPPISTNLPVPAEIESNNALVDELRRQGIFEAKDDTEKRHRVLESLQLMCDEFVTRVAREKEPALARDAKGKILTYGGFRLGVFGPGSDIDTLVVAPKYVTRKDYFDIFPNLLLEMAPKGAVTDISAVTDAFVPIIKFEYWGISIDLIFSRIPVLKKLPADTSHFNLQDTNLLRGLDEGEIRSINGTRVATEILDLVPEQGTFQMALRAIKLWAQRRAIYANVIGYPGGVAWALMVARVCQLYPRAPAATIVSKFFCIMRQWPWPQPLLLKHIERMNLGYRIWNPAVNHGDRLHLMPIITPAYPSMNSSFNITRSSMTIIQAELLRADGITDLIAVGKKPWSELFTKHSFFTTGYKYYLAVVSSGITKEAHKKWSGFVESKVRMLVGNLDRHDTIVVAQAFVKGFDRVHSCRTDEEIQKVQAGDLSFLSKREKNAGADAAAEAAPAPADSNGAGTNGAASNDATSNGADSKGDGSVSKEANADASKQEDTGKQEDAGKQDDASKQQDAGKLDESASAVKKDDEVTDIYTTTHYIGLELRQGSKAINLAHEVMEFKTLCHGWDKFDPELNALSVQHIRSWDLPDDVFTEGEVRPKKKTSKPKTNGVASAAATTEDSKKRAAPEQGTAPPSKRRQPASVAAAG